MIPGKGREMERWRLLEWQEVDGAFSAALDEALLLQAASAAAVPSLRFYTWRDSWLSLGSSQPIREVDLHACQRLGVRVVRRLSGGTATLNEHIVGFSVVIPASHRLAGRGLMDTYRMGGEALVAGLSALELVVEPVPSFGHTCRSQLQECHEAERRFCFAAQSPYEVVWQGRKLAGHAQVRRREGVIYHGLLFLAFEPRRLASLLRYEDEAEREAACRHLEARVASLGEAVARPLEAQSVAEAIATGFSLVLDVELQPDRLADDERELALELRKRKYATREWTFRR